MKRELRRAQRQVQNMKKNITEDERLMVLNFMRDYVSDKVDDKKWKKLVIFNSNERR